MKGWKDERMEELMDCETLSTKFSEMKYIIFDLEFRFDFPIKLTRDELSRFTFTEEK